MTLFVCPSCEATHTRGFIDGISLFRCLNCGYSGHGFNNDPAIDKELYAQHQEANALNRAHGIPEVPLGDDPLSHGGQP